nr:PREDICTED: uncharacterized protein LOC655486 isoform X4 [Tribolium castaneum]|eukprot:XP_015839741.1 PREDICTED: uncharacterized protein LOC655486 isoform X4 [Tribolium castaneum]
MLQEIKLILWKHTVRRKRRWLLTLTEFLIPILLFTLITYGRSKIKGLDKRIINYPTYYDIKPLHDVYSYLDVGKLNLLYSPYNNFTENVIAKVQNTLQIPGEIVKEFTSFETLKQHIKNGSYCTSMTVAINFKGHDPKHLNYDLSFYDKYLLWDTRNLFVHDLSVQQVKRSSKYLYKGFVAFQLAINLAFIELHEDKHLPINLDISIEEFPYPPHTDVSRLSQLFINYLPLITIFSFVFLCLSLLQRVANEKYVGSRELMKMVGMDSAMLWLGWFIDALTVNFFSVILIVILMKVPLWEVPYPLVEYSNGFVIFAFLLLYCMAAITFCFLIATIINKQTGVHWSNMFQSGSGGENDVTMGSVFIMLIVDMAVLTLLTIYIENIKPGNFGIAQPLNFPLIRMKNYLKKWFVHDSHADLTEIPLIDLEGRQKPPCIEIRNLYKKFNNTVAVNNLNMTINENHITVLLGHNGAGKTTTMHILTGMINATSGDIKIKGNNIKKNTSGTRKLLGLCTQHNLLFEDLTVFEHLKFFALIKRSRHATEEAETILQKLGFKEKRDEMVSTLSGGMKRKLCLGMALIGGSQILVLDEPTSGMDPESRRKVWDLLLEYRKMRTVLITTHLMEEADVLGDYIAIMENGQLQDCDTPYNLKKKYNTGYHLSLILKTRAFEETITKEIQRYISEAKLLPANYYTSTHDICVYLLPMNKRNKYKKVLELLEKRKDDWRIISIGLNLTTLNDVFLKARGQHLGLQQSEVDVKTTPDEIDVFHKRQGNFTCSMRDLFLALIIKRWYFFKKTFHWYFLCMISSIAIFLFAISLSISNVDYSNDPEPQLNLTLRVYEKSHSYYECDRSVELTKIASFYEKIVRQQGGYPQFANDVSEEIIQKGTQNIAFYKRHMITAAEFNKTSSNHLSVNVMYNRFALHGLPISINLASNAIAQTLLNESYSIITSNTPLKSFSCKSFPPELSVLNVAGVWVLLIPLSMLIFGSNFIIFPNAEVSTNFFQLQIFAGVKSYFYWLTNIFFDFVFSVLHLVLLFLSLWLLNLLAFNSILFRREEFETLMTICLLYMVTSLPFCYLFSFKKTMATGLTSFFVTGIFTGLTCTLVIVAMELSKDDFYIRLAKNLTHVFATFFPQFSLGYICTKFTTKFVENFNWKYMNPNKKKHICRLTPNPCCYGNSKECDNFKSYFFNDTVGIQQNLLEMFVAFGLYFLFLLLRNTEIMRKILHLIRFTPSQIYNKFTKQIGKHGNVPALWEDGGSENDALVAKKVVKTYGLKTILQSVTLRVCRTICFGLLGANGAGKSTIFNILTKSLFFDEGTVVVEGVPITRNDYTKKIGYCPQENYLNFYLTGRELVYTFACLKGYSDTDAQQVTKHLLKAFELEKYQDKPCSDYSGGNKRKLCSCLAFVGSPQIILLDEPTSGVDPSSRRTFWKIIRSWKKDTSFLLCSHSMEECENVWDEIAIMKKGVIEDKGSLLELKNKYNKGYTVTVKLKSDKDIDLLKQKLSELQLHLSEEYAGSLIYKIRNENKLLTEIFTTFDALQMEFPCIDDYIVNQISLEEIFLKLANDSGAATHRKKKRTKRRAVPQLSSSELSIEDTLHGKEVPTIMGHNIDDNNEENNMDRITFKNEIASKDTEGSPSESFMTTMTKTTENKEKSNMNTETVKSKFHSKVKKEIMNNREESTRNMDSQTIKRPNATNDINVIFKKRRRTVDLGKDYEHLFISYLILKLIENDTVEDFFISSNDHNYGVFDGVVLEVKYKGENNYQTYALQLTHEESGTLKMQDLTQAKGNFSIKKYFKDYEQNLSKRAVKVILFTNLKFQNCSDHLKLNLKNEERVYRVFDVEELEEYEKFNKLRMLMSVSEGNVYKVDSEEKFFENFFLFTNQLNIDGLKTACFRQFHNLFSLNKDICQKYLNFIYNWSLRVGQKEKLHKSWIEEVLLTLILTPNIRPLLFNAEPITKNAKLFKDAVSKFKITVLNKNSYEKVKFIWKNAIHNIDIKELNKIDIKYQIMFKNIQNQEELANQSTEKRTEINKLLWLMGKCPLIVEDNERITKTINLLNVNKQLVILCSEEKMDSLKCQTQNKSCFQHLANLKNEEKLYEDIIRSFTFSIEGQRPAFLKDLVRICKDVEHAITTDNLLQMVEGNLKIGKSEEFSLPPYYVPRNLTRILIDSKFLKKIGEDTLVTVSCVTHLDSFKERYIEYKIVILDDHFNEEDIEKKCEEKKVVYVTENECSQEQFDKLCSKYPKKTNCHLMKYRNLDCFEWIRSLKGVKHLRQFRLSELHLQKNKFIEESEFLTNSRSKLINFICRNPEMGKSTIMKTSNKNSLFPLRKHLSEFHLHNNNSIEETEFFTNSSNNIINSVCENPGMGKTMLMKSLKKNSSSSIWIIFIVARNHAQHFWNNSEADVEKFLNYIVTENYRKNDTELKVFQQFKSEKQIVLVWDGLDEISDKTLKIIKSIVSDVSSIGIRQWLTSRIHLENEIETEFDVFSRRIEQFREEEQKTFIKNRLQVSGSDSKSLNIFDKIKSHIRVSPYNDILGIPLHTYILTELFTNDKEIALNLLGKKEQIFLISDIYGYFVETIIEKFFKEKLKVDLDNDHMFEIYNKEKTNAINGYMKIAIHHYFPQFFNTDCQDIHKKKDPYGFIIKVTEDLTPQFLHNSFGEYFAALYLFENLEEIDKISYFIENGKYDNIRFFLDLNLSRNCKAHMAVLYKSSQMLDQCTEDELNHKDLFNRNSFQLSLEWNTKYPILKTIKGEDSFDIYHDEVIQTKNYSSISTCHYLRKFNEADLRLKKIILLCPFIITSDTTNLDEMHIPSILYYAVKYNHELILKYFDEIPLIKIYTKSLGTGETLLDLAIESKAFHAINLLLHNPQYRDQLKKEVFLSYKICASKSLEMLKAFINSGWDINEIHDDNMTVIHYASCNENDLSTLQFIIENGGNVNVRKKNSYELPIHFAFRYGSEDIVKLLFCNGSKIDVGDQYGNFPIHLACMNKKYAYNIVKLLLKLGQSLDICNKNGSFPVNFACQYGSVDVVKLLLDHGAKVDNCDQDGNLPIHLACENRKYGCGIVKLLLETGQSLHVCNKFGNFPIHIACEHGSVDVVQLLLDYGSKLDVCNQYDNLPIHLACVNEKYGCKIVKLLLKIGQSLDVCNKFGSFPINFACQYGNTDVVKLLLDHGSKIDVCDQDGNLPIHRACTNEKYGCDSVKLLLKKGQKLDVCNKNGTFPIHLACHYGSVDVVKLLLDHGSKVDVCDQDGNLPIHRACMNEKYGCEIVKLLLKMGQRLDACNKNNNLPIHFACQFGSLDVVKFLIGQGVKINACNQDGNLPIHFACMNKKYDYDIVKILLEHGAIVDVINKKGKKPIDLVLQNAENRQKLITLLQNLEQNT